MSGLVSVIVPCRDHGHFLDEALASITAQGQSVELIVVDDRSTDDTAAVARRHGALLVPSPAPGAAAARNAGVAAASGGILAFLDADDVWPQGSLLTRMAALDRHDAVYGAVQEYIDAALDPEAHTPRATTVVALAGSTILRREAWRDVGELDTSLEVGEFIDWMTRFAAAGLSAASVDDVVLRRRIHATNSTRVADPATYLAVARMHRLRRRSQ